MDQAAIRPESEMTSDTGGSELRRAPRFTLLIRSAKLLCPQGEFVCVIRDVSATGISMKLFHKLPADKVLALELQCGEIYMIRPVWEREGEAGFEFVETVDVEEFVCDAGKFPKRGLRLNIEIPITLKTLSGRSTAIISNLSQQGARFETTAALALDQSLRIEGRGLGEVYAKVRWRRECQFGVVFDDVLTLGDFARAAAKLQAPTLLLP
jgi:hypothetical protein